MPDILSRFDLITQLSNSGSFFLTFQIFKVIAESLFCVLHN